MLLRAVAGGVRLASREVDFSASDGSFGALGGAFCVEFDDEGVGTLCLGSNGREMGAIDAAGAAIGTAGAVAVLSGAGCRRR